MLLLTIIIVLVKKSIGILKAKHFANFAMHYVNIKDLTRFLSRKCCEKTFYLYFYYFEVKNLLLQDCSKEKSPTKTLKLIHLKKQHGT